MTCELWRDQIEIYVDGELAPSHDSEVARHMRACPECTAFAADSIHLKRGIASAGKRYQPSPDFRAQIARSLGSRKQSRLLALWPQFAIAALLVTAIGLGLLLYPRRNTGIDREIADVHLNTIASANPVDVLSSDKHTVKPWFQGKVPFTFTVPELANSPFSLVGGRVVYIRGTPMALLLFQYKLHRISVLIGASSALPVGDKSRQADGFHVVSWEKNGRTYFAIGDAEASIIEDLAQRMKAAEL